MKDYKKYFLYGSLVANAVLLTLLGVQLQLPNRLKKQESTVESNPREKQVKNNEEKDKRGAKKVSIALLHPASSCLVDMIIQGFKDELEKGSHLECSYADYDNRGDRTLLRSHVEDVISKDFDLIFTTGQATSILTAEILRKRRCNKPMVFTAVQDPVEAGIVPENRDRTCSITGSSSETVERHEQQFSLLLILKPDTKRLLIPYNPSCDTISRRKVANAEEYMLQRGIPVQKIEIFSIAECLEKIGAFVQQGDVIWVPRDPMIMATMQGIAKLASRYHATLYTSNFDAIEKGAALAFGVDDKDSGYNAGTKAREILVEGKHPSEIPVNPPSSQHYLWINRNVLKSQGVEIDPLFGFLMEYSRIVDTKKL